MKRPDNMQLKDYLDWVIEHELEEKPKDLIKDCWRVSKDRSIGPGGRPLRSWKGFSVTMCHLTYMSLHKIEKNPFSQQLHAAHDCNNSWCVNPYHITPKTAEENERDKEKEPGWEAYKKQQRETQLKLHAQNKIMPSGLTMKEKAQWILDNNTYTNENGCMIYTGGGGNGAGYGRRNITIAKGK